ncbi:hypothetical protein L0B53_03750 [Vibrio sp. SS-MA-C1-2]|uniref:hypothetical protein n=1 Tax=Vibrio sp. SS-MA-C1-2 TaxID=2908646 RepID=UPI001F27DEA7|nr:hypothetical protein [Vibrio sp. SS-MA-C1-2]UJF17059.1 hypothetical protein L0B53_03750 [Vibrio sp. SS-MA-C1-2]
MGRNNKVVNNTYITGKTMLHLNHDHVRKVFKPSVNAEKRYKCEKEALSRLEEAPFIPNMIHSINFGMTLYIKRINGACPNNLTSRDLVRVRNILRQVRKCGVARHSTPIRDLIKNEDGLFMVDFERVTILRWWNAPYWMIVSLFSHYHLLRLVHEHQPQLLSQANNIRLNRIETFRLKLNWLIQKKKQVSRFKKQCINNWQSS